MLGISSLRFIGEIKDRCRMHSHEQLEIVYNIKGEGSIYLEDGKELKLQAHTVTIYKPFVEHAQVMKKPGVDYCLQVDIGSMNSLEKYPDVHHIPLLENTRIRNEIVSIVKTQCDPLSDYSQILNFRVSSLLLELYQVKYEFETASIVNKLEKAKLYIEQHFYEITSIKEVAAISSFSEDYFRHQFKKRYSLSPKEYLLNCQLDHAQKLLVHSPLPQKAIAQQSGFNNLQYFNTRFKHYVGMSPGEYRTKARQ